MIPQINSPEWGEAMSSATKVRIIDADAHVIETERTWDYLEPSEEKFRPTLFSNPNVEVRQYWIIDGKARGFRFPTLSEQQMQHMGESSGRTVLVPGDAKRMDDIELRLAHMDKLGIDMQVLHHTMWIEQVSDRPDIEAALCRSWNRWMADVWKQGQGRLVWSTVLPYLDIPEAIAQMRTARDNGAVSIAVRPIEGNRLITDPYYYPVYEEASRLNMAVAIHIANGNPANCDLMRSPWDAGGTFATFRAPTVTACHTLLMSEVPATFPGLRWAFVEASAQWVPWIIREAKQRFEFSSLFGVSDDTPMNELLSSRKIYVTAQNSDDIPYIIDQAGEDTLVIGTDYGHTDPSTEVDAIEVFKETFAGKLSEVAMRKVLSDNPAALYSLD